MTKIRLCQIDISYTFAVCIMIWIKSFFLQWVNFCKQVSTSDLLTIASNSSCQAPSVESVRIKFQWMCNSDSNCLLFIFDLMWFSHVGMIPSCLSMTQVKDTNAGCLWNIHDAVFTKVHKVDYILYIYIYIFLFFLIHTSKLKKHVLYYHRAKLHVQ